MNIFPCMEQFGPSACPSASPAARHSGLPDCIPRLTSACLRQGILALPIGAIHFVLHRRLARLLGNKYRSGIPNRFKGCGYTPALVSVAISLSLQGHSSGFKGGEGHASHTPIGHASSASTVPRWFKAAYNGSGAYKQGQEWFHTGLFK